MSIATSLSVLADVTTKTVWLRFGEGTEASCDPERAILLARELMHAAYALGYEPPKEQK